TTMVHTTRMQNTFLRQMKRWGAIGALRRDGSSDREAWMAILDFNPRDRDLIEQGYRRCVIAAKGLDVPPDRELDVIVFNGEIWRIQSPVRGPRPNGVPIFYECEVNYDSRDV